VARTPTVFAQVLKHVCRKQFQASVSRHNGDRGIRSLDCWSWFGALLFGQLTGHDSIRAIERVFCQGNHRMQALGFSPVCRSTLADANQVRPVEILEDTLRSLLARARRICPGLKHGFKFKGDVHILDSTIINLCLSLSPWANFRKGKAAVKLHTAIDLAGDLPDFFVITEAKVNDLRAAKQHFQFAAGTTLVFDRGYWDSSWLSSLNESDVYFVTRARRNNRFKVVESRPTDRTQGFICDQVVYQKASSNYKGKQYRGKLRRISFNDPDPRKRLTFLTNRFDLATATICALYKARWKVELFFKCLKQNLKIRKFLGTSAQAVKAQILVALIAYLLIQITRLLSCSRISIPDTMAVIGVLLLLREPLKRILGDLPRTTRYPPASQLVLNL
jgi:hypothetical protein